MKRHVLHWSLAVRSSMRKILRMLLSLSSPWNLLPVPSKHSTIFRVLPWWRAARGASLSAFMGVTGRDGTCVERNSSREPSWEESMAGLPARAWPSFPAAGLRWNLSIVYLYGEDTGLRAQRAPVWRDTTSSSGRRLD